MIKIEKTPFGQAINPITTKPVDVHRYILSNNKNLSVAILTRGATIQSIKYPDKNGKIEDICLGFDSIEEYNVNKSMYLGATVGRVAGLVPEAKFKMDDNEYTLTKNLKDKHQINGGLHGFDSMIWEVSDFKPTGIVMEHINPPDYEGYPGELNVTISFTLDDDNNFDICIEAQAKENTPVNIANYLYLNLGGHNSRQESLFLHNIMIKSDKVIDCDLEHIPTGSLMPVVFTPYNLRKYVNLGKRIQKFFGHPIKGFDNYFCIDGCDQRVMPVAKVIHPGTGRWVEVCSNQRAVHFSTCNDWPDIEEVGVLPVSGKGKAVYAKYGAFCLSTQNYPDAMNHEKFPSIFQDTKKKYCHKVIYRFGCCCD